MRAFLLATLLFYLIPGQAHAQQEIQPQAYAPRREAMSFRLAQGSGPNGEKSWIAATGQINFDTAQIFTKFAQDKSIAGLTIVLDSGGGSVEGGFRLGRQLRTSNIKSTVGRTVTLASGDVVISRGVSCSSACVLALMGGFERTVPEDATIGVHLFSVSLDREGNRAKQELSVSDFESGQRVMARHASYVEEMGIAARYLVLMGEASFKGDIRRLTPAEITSIRLASMRKPDVLPLETSWFASPQQASPQLTRQRKLKQRESVEASKELTLTCNNVRGFVTATFRTQLRQIDEARSRQNVELTLVRLETGGWDFLFRPPNSTVLLTKIGADYWMRRDIPRRVFEDAIANRRLSVEVRDRSGKPATEDFFEPSFGEAFSAFAKRCDAQPGLSSIGPHPRH